MTPLSFSNHISHKKLCWEKMASFQEQAHGVHWKSSLCRLNSSCTLKYPDVSAAASAGIGVTLKRILS